MTHLAAAPTCLFNAS